MKRARGVLTVMQWGREDSVYVIEKLTLTFSKNQTSLIWCFCTSTWENFLYAAPRTLRFPHLGLYMYTYAHLDNIYIYIYIYVCMCVFIYNISLSVRRTPRKRTGSFCEFVKINEWSSFILSECWDLCWGCRATVSLVSLVYDVKTLEKLDKGIALILKVYILRFAHL